MKNKTLYCFFDAAMQLVAKKTQNLTITLRHYFHNL